MSTTKIPPRQPWIVRRWWLLMAPMIASAWVRDLWAPDEPRYAEVAREVYDGSSFLVMHLCGAVYPDKPPLLFWMSGFFGWVSGWSELWMRLPTLATTLGTAWLVGRVARRWWGDRVAPWASALYLSTMMITEIGGRLQIDPLLGFFCLLALEFVSRPADGHRRRVGYVLAAGLCVGIGGLAKGPVALVNVGLVLLAWRFFGPRDELPRAGWPGWAGAACLATAPMVMWALLATAVHPELGEELFFGQHAGRVTRADRHPGPPWEHLLRMPMLLLPWTTSVIGGLAAGLKTVRRRARPSADHGLIYAALWFVALVLFYSVIPPKRDLYLLLAYPAAALMGAAYLVGRIDRGRASKWVTLPGPLALGLVGIALTVAPWLIDAVPGLSWHGPAVGLTVTACAAWTLVVLKRRGLTAWASTLFATWGVFGVLVAVVLFQLANPIKSTRGIAEAIAARSERPTEIPCLGVRPEGFRFYGNGAVPAVLGHDLAPFLEREGSDFLALIHVAGWREAAPALRSRLRVLDEYRVGDTALVLVGAVKSDENH